MKKKDMLQELRKAAKEQSEFCDNLPAGSQTWSTAFRKEAALEEAIKRLDTPSDRCVANELLLWVGLILSAVGIIAVVCGVGYILLANYDAAWAMLPWAVISAIAALLSFAGVRK